MDSAFLSESGIWKNPSWSEFLNVTSQRFGWAFTVIALTLMTLDTPESFSYFLVDPGSLLKLYLTFAVNEGAQEMFSLMFPSMFL